LRFDELLLGSEEGKQWIQQMRDSYIASGLCMLADGKLKARETEFVSLEKAALARTADGEREGVAQKQT